MSMILSPFSGVVMPLFIAFESMTESIYIVARVSPSLDKAHNVQMRMKGEP
jgi:hypothetical protein